ncbi:hypothetical protein DLM45_03730 [Hyphomicrobium methylovorum]|nr:hypothetical protein [Hyphomicrobium methylovorum]
MGLIPRADESGKFVFSVAGLIHLPFCGPCSWFAHALVRIKLSTVSKTAPRRITPDELGFQNPARVKAAAKFQNIT